MDETKYFPVWRATGLTDGCFFTPHRHLMCDTPEDTARFSSPFHIPLRDIRHVVLCSRQQTKYEYIGAIPVTLIGDGQVRIPSEWNPGEVVVTANIGGAPVPCTVIAVDLPTLASPTPIAAE